MTKRASTAVAIGLSTVLLSACEGTGPKKIIPNAEGVPNNCTTTSQSKSRDGQVGIGVGLGIIVEIATGVPLSGLFGTIGGAKDAGDEIEVTCPDKAEAERTIQRPERKPRQDNRFRAPIPEGYKPLYPLGTEPS